MIGRLAGTLAEKAADRIILDVQGVGYQVHVPLSTFYDLGEEGSRVMLHVYTHVTENSLGLYGFLTPKEKTLFLLLIQISGIGPKLATTVLSGLPADELAAAVARGDLLRLTRIPGVGRKTAERMVLELKDKMRELAPERAAAGSPAGALQNDVVSALINLGYPSNQAEKAVSRAAEGATEPQFETLLKGALRRLSG